MARIEALSAILLIIISMIATTWTEWRLKPSHNLYKVALTQRGYIQFLRYQVDMPELHDFTLCIWMKTTNFTNSHPLFSYSKDEKERLVRSWLSPPTQSRKSQINLEIMEKDVMNVAVDIIHGRWYHLCQSWSNTAGQWVLHVNGKLTAAGDNWQLKGLVVPGGGDVVVGQEYTDFDKGLDDGIEGEIFGFNLLTSHSRNVGPIHSPLPSSNHIPGFLFGSPSVTSLKIQDDPFIASQHKYLDKSAKTPYWLSFSPFRSLREALRSLSNDVSKKNIRWPDETRDSRSTVESPSRRADVRWPEDHENINKRRNRRSTMQDNVNTSQTKEKRDTNVVVDLPDQRIRGERSYLQSWGLEVGDAGTKLNPGLELVEKSYSQCTVGRGSPVDKSALLIAWASTPVRVFGGAVIKNAKPICGDF